MLEWLFKLNNCLIMMVYTSKTKETLLNRYLYLEMLLNHMVTLIMEHLFYYILHNLAIDTNKKTQA